MIGGKSWASLLLDRLKRMVGSACTYRSALYILLKVFVRFLRDNLVSTCERNERKDQLDRGLPLTPAPMTLGRSWLPMVKSMPMAQLTKETIMTVKPARSQKGMTTSFFWQAGPPQLVVFLAPPSRVITVAEQAHE